MSTPGCPTPFFGTLPGSPNANFWQSPRVAQYQFLAVPPGNFLWNCCQKAALPSHARYPEWLTRFGWLAGLAGWVVWLACDWLAWLVLAGLAWPGCFGWAGFDRSLAGLAGWLGWFCLASLLAGLLAGLASLGLAGLACLGWLGWAQIVLCYVLDSLGPPICDEGTLSIKGLLSKQLNQVGVGSGRCQKN